PLLVTHLRLADPLKLVFDGVFQRQDVLLLAVDLPQGRVERRALAAAGRAGDQQQAVLDADELPEGSQGPLVHAQLGQLVQPRAALSSKSSRPPRRRISSSTSLRSSFSMNACACPVRCWYASLIAAATTAAGASTARTGRPRKRATTSSCPQFAGSPSATSNL